MLKVLIVDDSLAARKYALKALESGDFEVLTAESAMEALKICDENIEDLGLIIADVNMPEMSGIEMLEEFNRSYASYNIPKLMRTSESAEEYRDKAIELGIVGWILKPLNKDSILKVVKHIIK